MADPNTFIYDLRCAGDKARVDWLGIDTEGNRHLLPNLLTDQGITLRLWVDGKSIDAQIVPARVEPLGLRGKRFQIETSGLRVTWDIALEADKFLFQFRCEPAHRLERAELEFAFDPRVTPTTVLPARWTEDHFELPMILSAPDFGQIGVESDRAMRGRFEGSRAAKTANVILELPIGNTVSACTLHFSPQYLEAPAPLVDNAMWRLARRGWWGNIQATSRWGEQNRPFSAPPGVLGNNVISDPASCSLWFYADQILLMPAHVPLGISAEGWLRRTIDFWLDQRTDAAGEVICYWDYKHFLDANAGPLIASWDYVERSGDRKWLADRVDVLERIADFLARRDIDGDGMVEATQSGNLGTLHIPARSCAWWDALNCGHKDGYTNALIYRAWRCLADLELQLNRAEKAKHYHTLADRLRDRYSHVLFNDKTGWLGWWRSEDGQLHDYASPTLNGLAIEYGLVSPDRGKEILRRLWEKIEAVGFTHFELGIPPMLIPVLKGDYLQPDAIGCPQREDGTDTFGVYINGGITAGHTLHFLMAHYVLGQPERADRMLKAMLEREQHGAFQNGVTDAAMKGIDWTNWKGEPTGYEGYLADSFRFLQAVLLREKAFRDKLYRPMISAV